MIKRLRVTCCVVTAAWATLALLATSRAVAQEARFEELAKRVVNVSASVKRRDVVVIYGGKHTVALMQALAIEANKAGGRATIFLDYDRVLRSFFTEVDAKYLEQEPTFFGEWLKHVDVWINLAGTQNPKAVCADIPRERLAKVQKANEFLSNVLNESGVRLVNMGYPTEEAAVAEQMGFSTYERMHWDAVNANQKLISEKANELRSLLEAIKEVRVSTPSGTNLTFSVGGRRILINDGIVTEEEAGEQLILTRFANLPGGSLFVAPIESSANGKVVVPKDRCKYEPMTGVSFEFKNGLLQNFKAERGDKCFEETMAPYTGPKTMFGAFSIGLNPALKVVEEGADYRPGEAPGMVSMSIGNNELLGGNNKTQGGFGFSLVKATVAVDGRVVVKDGQLVF